MKIKARTVAAIARMRARMEIAEEKSPDEDEEEPPRRLLMISSSADEP